MTKAKSLQKSCQSCSSNVIKVNRPQKKQPETYDRRELKNAFCSVCLEYPHNAVLILCSSYEKGCRPYMCATGRRFSNCLEQYKKAYTKVLDAQSKQEEELAAGNSSNGGLFNEKVEIPELLCPLCRGQVKGWTVFEPARKYFNAKKRSCMQDNCQFVGNYKQLRRHVKEVHPSARPRAVDPVREEKWKMLEQQREQSDVISTLMSSIPGAVVLGDYVLEPNQQEYLDNYDSEEYSDDDTFPFESFLRNIPQVNRRRGLPYREDDFGSYRVLAARARNYRRFFDGASRRRRRRLT